MAHGWFRLQETGCCVLIEFAGWVARGFSRGEHEFVFPTSEEVGHPSINTGQHTRIGRANFATAVTTQGEASGEHGIMTEWIPRHAGNRRNMTACMTLLMTAASFAAEQAVIPHGQDRAPGPPLTPARALEKMTVPDGFHVQLVASEPDIVNPVAMTFDSRGRIWITESLEYPRRSPGPGRDRIKILEDTDGDGTADTFKIFADGLNIPSGIALGYGGVYVANAPDLLFLRDTDGDDVADTREVLLTGFGRHDVHELPNALTWGPDGWLYGLNGVFNPAHIKHKGREYKFTCAVWRFHPVTKDFELFSEGTSNPWGLDYDHEGSFFISACVIDHLWHQVQTGYYHRQGGPYPPYTWKIESIVDHRHYKAAYCGLCIYDADAYPAEYRGAVFMGNIHENAINHDVLERKGATYVAKARPNFLEANDEWFMPVVQKVGPDGSVYVADWYDRYHCYQDANRDPEGVDRLKGRIWRVVYGDTKWPDKFDLKGMPNETLVDTLSHPNGWWRRQAQKLLIERADHSVQPRLESLALSDASENPAARHALWTLVSRGQLKPAFHEALLRHADPIVRAWGVRAAAEMRRVAPPIRRLIRERAGDDSPDVRLQVAIAARRIEAMDAVATLLDVMDHAQPDELLPPILWQNLYPLLADNHRRVTARLAAGSLDSRPSARALAGRILEYLLISEAGNVTAFAQLLRQTLTPRGSQDGALRHAGLVALTRAVSSGELSDGDQSRVRRTLLEPLRRLLTADGDERALSVALLTRWNDPAGVAAARTLVADERASWSSRRDAMSALATVDGSAVLGPARTILTTSSASREQHRDVIAALAASREPAVAGMLIGAWSELADGVAPLAADLLARRREWARPLLEAIERKAVPRAAINTNQARQITGFGDDALNELLTEAWGTLRSGRNPEREKLIRQTRNMVRRGTGDAVAGQQVFIKLCAQCHKLYDYGAEVGPDLTGVGRSELDQLLSNILDPSLVIGAGYESMMVLTVDGEVLTGLPVEDSDERLVLKLNGGTTITLPREDVEQTKLADLSLMPEDLQKGLSDQEFRDLIELLMTKERPAPWPDVEPVITPLP